MSQYQVTNAQGQVTFNLPQEDYKVRADYLSGQYFSDIFNWMDTEVDIDHGLVDLHVTFNGDDVFDAPVYLFTESGSYLGRYERTDYYGHVEFLIPAKSYKFRVDYDGTQYWSDVVNVISHEETDVELPLEQLAFNLTNDPNPVRFDGKPPIFKGEEIRVASIGSLVSILSQTVVANTSSPKVYYYLNDHLGTPQIITDEDGEVVWRADYRPFGEATVDPVSLTTNNFRFPGQYYDHKTGLYYNWHRFYEPTIGRYLTPDPIGLYGGDMNLYAYVRSNPIVFIDPLGLEVYIGSRAKKPYKSQHGILHHKFVYIKNGKLPGGEGYFGFYSNFVIGPGKIAINEGWDVNWQQHDGRLIEIKGVDEDLLIKKIMEDVKNPPFFFFVGNNCQDWVKEKIVESQAEYERAEEKCK